MARIAAVTNLKGGIGKTTTVVNLGAGFALKGLRVLLVDVDAQGNLAISLGVKPKRTLYEVLVDNALAADCLTAARPNLHLLAADDSLLTAQTSISSRSDWSRMLDKALAPLKHSYDVILIDAPGSLTALSINAIMAARDLVVPTTVEPLSIKGLSLLFKQVTRVKNGASSIRVIVPTMFDARMRQSVDLLTKLKQTYGTRLTPPIRANVRLSEATAQGKTIYEYDPRSRGSLDYAHLVERLSDLWGLQSAQLEADAHAFDRAPVVANKPPAAPLTHMPAATLKVSQVNGVSATSASPAANHQTNHHIPTQTTTAFAAPQPASRTQTNHHQPVVTGTHGVSRPCPLCGHQLRRTIVAGYRVAYCDNCKYMEQELASGVRR